MSEEALVANIGPLPTNIEYGKDYYWCRCGRSKNQPLCDGSHKETSFRPVKFRAMGTSRVFLCGCKRTGVQPYCDGSHEKL